MKKLIKKLVLKYLVKYTGNEFTQMDNRVNDIEVKLGIKKPEHDAGSKYVGDMAVKDAEYLKGVVFKKETVGLPELWVVTRTRENFEKLNEWAFINFGNRLSDDCYFMSCKGDVFLDKPTTYTEISFSDFERLVLKKELVEKTEELEIGRWYKGNESIVCYQGAPDKDQGYPTFKGYGFVEGEWFGKESSEETYNGWTIASYWNPASNEEVEAALINEAKRRYPIGSTVSSAMDGSTSKGTLDGNEKITITEYHIHLFEIGRYDNVLLFNPKTGIWADIVENPKQEIDFSVPGQLLESDWDFVLTTGHDSEDVFSCFVVSTEGKTFHKGVTIGHVENDLLKHKYKLYNGELTLKN